MTIDYIGLALDLESRANTVKSQTTERSMIAAANALRAIASCKEALAPGAAPSAKEGEALTDALLQSVAERIAASTCPEEESKLEIAYAIARHLNLDGWPAAWEAA